MSFPDDMTIAVMTEEFAHEIAGPVTYVEGFVRDIAEGGQLSSEDLAIAFEEIARMRTLLGGLRHYRMPELQRTPLDLRSLIDSARVSCGRCCPPMEWTTDVPSGLAVDVHESYAERVLAPLLRTAFWMAPASDRIVLSAVVTGKTVALGLHLIAVARDVPAVSPWSAPSPAALDLLFARRIARAHGHQLEFERDGDSAVLRLQMPLADRPLPRREPSTHANPTGR